VPDGSAPTSKDAVAPLASTGIVPVIGVMPLPLIV
jgi:hypothetical protein